jgi:hypothetical protein
LLDRCQPNIIIIDRNSQVLSIPEFSAVNDRNLGELLESEKVEFGFKAEKFSTYNQIHRIITESIPGIAGRGHSDSSGVNRFYINNFPLFAFIQLISKEGSIYYVLHNIELNNFHQHLLDVPHATTNVYRWEFLQI